MNLFDIVVVLLLCSGSFVFGMKVADYYRDEADAQTKAALQKQYVQMQSQAHPNDPVAPYVWTPPRKPFSVSEEFVRALRRHGRAVQAVKKQRTH